MADFKTVDCKLYMSYRRLMLYGVNKSTIKNWKNRNISNVIFAEKQSFILYDSIPESTRKKLPSLNELKKLKIDQEREEKSEQVYEFVLNGMQYAYERNFLRFRGIYEEAGVPHDKVTDYARHHAVWQYFLDTFFSEPGLISPVKEGAKAYNVLYPGRLSRPGFIGCLQKAKKEGVESILIRKKGQGRKKEFTEVYEYWVMQLSSSGKAYSQAAIHREICDMCDELDYKQPSLTTIKSLFRKWLPIIADSRYGKDKTRFSKMGYVSIIPAENANDQWQIDGWRIPFYAKGYKTLCLFWVLDAQSRRIVGYRIAETENTETIMDGLEDAVRKTGALPYEIVSDNHSFNQTKIAENFKSELDKMGVHWTVTENPRYKALVERSFGVFAEEICKKQYGYIGQGIKTKNPDGRTSQELFDKYTNGKGWLELDQIKAIIVYCVDEFNKRADKQGKTPITRYEESQKPNEVRFNGIETNANFYRLFTRDMDTLTVRKNQLKITRAGVEYEFLLNAELAHQWNDKGVRVRYVSLSDGVYIYDPETDEALGFVHRKRKAHGALANQTEDDVVTMSITKAVNKSVQNKNKEAIQQLHNEIQNIDPKAAELVNQRSTPKNVVEELKKRSDLAEEFHRNGGDVSRLPDIPVACESVTVEAEVSLDKNRKAKSPFYTEKKIDLSKILDY